MSVKRQATTQLTHENWDQDDPADHEEMGTFKVASKDMLEKRVIRTAKRRTQVAGEEPKKSVFSGFGGFNKAPPASFDFLSKLTNGTNDNNSSSSKADSSVTSSLFTNKPLAASPSSGIFGNNSTTAPTKSSPFASPSTQTGLGSVFGVSPQNTSSSPSMFITSKADSTVKDSPFKIQTVTSSTDNKTDSTKSSIAPVTSSKFDIPSTSANVAKSLFSTTSSSTPFKIQAMSNASSASTANTFGIISKPESSPNDTQNKSEDCKNDKKMKYYSKLKGLNESVSDWIKKHVEQTPLCILTPIFKDYEKYLKEIQDEYQTSGKEENDKKADDKNITTEMKPETGNAVFKPVTTTTTNMTGSSIFNASPSSKFSFATESSSTTATMKKPATFSFGVGSSTSTSSTLTTSSAGFSFGAITSSTGSAQTTSPFSLSTTTTTSNGPAAPFSFGTGKPFSFNSNVTQKTETTEAATEDEDAPPKVEFTPVVEENSVYDKRCKVFVKKDGNFVDKGVGTLYIKKIEDSDKHQLLIRANTNLGTILVNLILVSAIPTQRMGKNNVMLVCIPTPESKPPPTPMLIRVKTSEEADELLETLNKYKT